MAESSTRPTRRDYSMFDAELSGAVLNLSLLRRLLRWMKPYRVTFAISAVLTGMHPLLAACLVYALVYVGWAVTGHAHRMTLISSVVNGLRDLRQDLFIHLETRPSSFYDRVAVGRVMTRVTNDVEALYELLRGIGTLIGEFVPFFVALAIDVELTLILLLVLPAMGSVTYLFRRATRQLFRLVRLTVSSLNQYMQENLAGLQVVQLSDRQAENLSRYTEINEENRRWELKSARLETLYGAFTDSMAHIALGVIIWYGGGEVVQGHMSLGGVILFTRFIDMLFHPIVVLGEQTNIHRASPGQCQSAGTRLGREDSRA